MLYLIHPNNCSPDIWVKNKMQLKHIRTFFMWFITWSQRQIQKNPEIILNNNLIGVSGKFIMVTIVKINSHCLI